MPSSARPFALVPYILLVIAFSWPFQFLYVVLGESYRPVLLLSMICAGIGTWVAGRFVFRDGFSGAGWNFGKPRYYFVAIALSLLLWLAPIGIEWLFDLRPFPDSPSISSIAFLLLVSSALTVLPAFGEEFSWRGYLLPRLLKRHSRRKALLLHGFITWFWHLPFLVAIGLQQESNAIATAAIVLLISLVPAIMHALVFAWFWSRSGSLFVATFYHVAFDEVRDTLQAALGFGWLSENWQMLLLTLIGVSLLVRLHWLDPNQKPPVPD